MFESFFPRPIIPRDPIQLIIFLIHKFITRIVG